MNLIFMGPPGAGKGTQAERIVSQFRLPHISTGDAFRLAKSQGTPLGLEAQHYMDQGLYVPDDITIGIVRERLQQDDCRTGFMLDGFPRTLPQAEALEEFMQSENKEITHVINLNVDRSLLLKRLTGRRICDDCGATYHLIFNPPAKQGICNKCDGELSQRTDDSEEKVGTRLEQYLSKTAPLLEYYEHKGLLRQVNGEAEIDAVTKEIYALLQEGSE